MKKTILSAIAATLISGSAFAATNPSATLVFEGFISSVTPSDAWTITGIGGVGTPGKGTLSIDLDGKVTTSVPVIFEVREVPAAGAPVGTIGDLATSYKVRYVSSALTAGSATPVNAENKVILNDVLFNSVGEVTGAAVTIPQSTVEFENAAGFDIDQVGSGEAVQSSVVIMIEDATA